MKKLPSPELGRLIRSSRLALGMSQAEVAKQLNLMGIEITREHITAIEAGKVELPGRDALRGIAKVLGLSMTQILESAEYLPTEEGAKPPEIFASKAGKLTPEQWQELIDITDIIIERDDRRRRERGG